MTDAARSVQRIYLVLTLLTTLAASFIWGVNTLFLLDAGLSNAEAFAANAFFSLGQVIFEVPTGVVADTRGRRFSFLLGAATLLIATLLYLYMWNIHAPFWGWAIASAMLGLGFTFFSGATEAWLVDALTATGYTKDLETVFGRAQVVGGGAMLVGTVLGGVVAQFDALGVPYILRAGMLGVTLVVAWLFMRTSGSRPTVRPARRGRAQRRARRRGRRAPQPAGPLADARRAVQHGRRLLRVLRVPAVPARAVRRPERVQHRRPGGGDHRRRADPRRLHGAVGPALLHSPHALPHPRDRRSVVLLAAIGITDNFVVALVVLTLWCVIAAIEVPMQRAFLNPLIPSEQRATVLSFDSLMGSTGGVVIQPILGRTADAFGYGTSYLVAAGIQTLSLPFVILARRENAPSDPIRADLPEDAAVEATPAA